MSLGMRKIVAWSVIAMFCGCVVGHSDSFANPPQQPPPPPSVLVRTAFSGAAWMPGEEVGQPPADQKRLEDKLDKIIDQNARLLKLLEELMKEGTEAVNPPAADPKGAEYLTAGLTVCVQCHNERDAQKKGDRFVLFRYQKQDNKDVPALREDLSLREWKSIEREVKAGTMPKKTSGQRLTKEQSDAILAEAGARRTELEGK
jgi:mono/diheme cytochrome c family protein